MKVIFSWLILASPLWACYEGTISGIDLVSAEHVTVAPAEAPLATVAVFLSPRCPCSLSHEPKLNQMAKQYPNIRFVGIHANADEPVAESKQHFKSASLGFPVIRDSDSRLANAFGALKTPHAFVIDKSGKCIFKGGLDDSHMADQAKTEYLSTVLADISQGKEPSIHAARPMGCVISR